MNSHDIRKKFQNYFTKRDHLIIPSSSLIGGSNLLFTNAGMNQFKNMFLGVESYPHPQVCSIQKCLRAGGKHNDLEQVGYSAFHHTFFEMLGYFSFGSYFKKEAIHYAMDFLINELGIAKEKLWVSVFTEDKETEKIWKTSQNIPSEKIFRLGEKDNFWRMGSTGPCGPCSEIYYYNGQKKDPKPEDMTEIWNLVFMEYNEDHTRQKIHLPKLCVDTGMGLERITTILQDKKSNYQTDIFKDIIKEIEATVKIKYNFIEHSIEEEQVAFRVIADHARAISFLICDGILPGNEGAAYVLRRILRRALFYSQKLNPEKNLLTIATEQVAHFMGDIYSELNEHQDRINKVITEEDKLFTKNLQRGKKIFVQKFSQKKIHANKSKDQDMSSKVIDDVVVWDLYSTYGFPLDLIRLMAHEKGLKICIQSLEELKKKYVKDPQNINYKDDLKNNLLEVSKKTYSYFGDKKTLFTGYKTNKEKSSIILLFSKVGKEVDFAKTVVDFAKEEVDFTKESNNIFWLVLDKTCFYPEGGGPIGDIGWLKTQTGEAKIIDCQKEGNFIYHKVVIQNGIIKKDQLCEIEVDKDHRNRIAANHSSTHLLNNALRSVLGSLVKQMGSLVDPKKLRFDFSYSKPLTQKQIEDIEKHVNQSIKDKHIVSSSYHSYVEAIKKGAIYLAGENYNKENVRLIQIGSSLEFCGGIHVKNTMDIRSFKIISETGVQSGVRRILAYTHDTLDQWVQTMKEQNKKVRDYLKIPTSNKNIEKINPFIHWFEKKKYLIKSLENNLKNLNIHQEIKMDSLAEDSIIKKVLKTQFDLDIGILSSYQDLFLVKQNMELRRYLNIPDLIDIDQQADFFISFFKKTEERIKKLYMQLDNLSKFLTLENIIKQAKPFECHGIKAKLLLVSIPIEDRKILMDATEQLKCKLSSPSIVITLGEGEGSYPLIMAVGAELQPYISAAEAFKTIITPLLQGKGGGQKRFAQGVVKNKKNFLQLEKEILNFLKTL